MSSFWGCTAWVCSWRDTLARTPTHAHSPTCMHGRVLHRGSAQRTDFLATLCTEPASMRAEQLRPRWMFTSPPMHSLRLNSPMPPNHTWNWYGSHAHFYPVYCSLGHIFVQVHLYEFAFFFSSQPPKSENAEYYLYMDMQRADGDIESCVVNVHHQRNSLIEGLFDSCLHIIVFHYYKIIATRNVRHATIYTSWVNYATLVARFLWHATVSCDKVFSLPKEPLILFFNRSKLHSSCNFFMFFLSL